MSEPLHGLQAPAFAAPPPFALQATAWLADDENAIEVVREHLTQRHALAYLDRSVATLMLQYLHDDAFIERCMTELRVRRGNSEMLTMLALDRWWPGCDRISDPE